MLETPVLFLVFNRPDVTRRVFEKIREVQPKQLFIAADGPRQSHLEDVEKCKEVREIVSCIDWDCQVSTLFREENLGCGQAVNTAITWFFDTIEQGIILEDDTLPERSFFYFCSALLKKYEDDKRIMMVCGNNGLGRWETRYSYFFSQLGAIWGWATWRRAWKLYDFYVKKWQIAKRDKVLFSVFRDENRAAYRETILDNIYAGKIDTWDYQWSFTRLTNSGLSILPSANLICNIGFGEDATHTKQKPKKYKSQTIYPSSFPLIHPDFVVSDECFDKKLFEELIGYKSKKRLINKIRSNGFFGK